MDISVEHEHDYVLAKLSGSFDSSEISKLRDELLPIVKADNAKLLVDLSKLNYVMSEGLGQFVNLVVEARKTSSRVVFFSPTTLVDTVIKASNLNKVLSMADSLDSAVESIVNSDGAK